MDELPEFLAWLESVDYLAAFDPDQPRDERGRFSNLGSSDAASKSGKASKTGKAEDHKAAADAHAEAADNHAKEADRRRSLAAKSRKKADRERHLVAAEKHDDAAAHHREMAKTHAKAATPKPGAKLTELGIINKNLSPDARAAAEKAISRAGLESYLKKQPLKYITHHASLVQAKKLGLSEDDKKNVRNANGVYLHSPGKPGKMSIKDDASLKETWDKMNGGDRAPLGKVWAVSSKAKTAAELRERTIAHEMGHHLHDNPLDRLGLEHRVDIDTAFDARVDDEGKLRPGAFTVSKYARASSHEWFAETHSAFVYHPKELRRKDPEAYDLVKRVREARGLT